MQTTRIKEEHIKESTTESIKGSNLPEKKFRAGAICATVWLNKGHKVNGEETEYKTIALERSYTDKDGKWQSTNSFRVGDLPKATVVMQQAYEYLVLKEQDISSGAY